MYRKLRFPTFKPYLKEIYREDCSCGGHLVSIITGVPLKFIKNLHPDNTDWSLEWVTSFLALAGYNLVEVHNNFIDKRKGFGPTFHPDHLMVYVLGIDKNESTWACSHRGKVYHGQHLFKKLSGVDILNNYPLERLWICYKARKKRANHKVKYVKKRKAPKGR